MRPIESKGNTMAASTRSRCREVGSWSTSGRGDSLHLLQLELNLFLGLLLLFELALFRLEREFGLDNSIDLAQDCLKVIVAFPLDKILVRGRAFAQVRRVPEARHSGLRAVAGNS